jgi:hypothetical protein
MTWTPEQKAAIDEIVERRLIADRRTRTRALQALILERDGLAVEVSQLRAALQRHQRNDDSTM